MSPERGSLADYEALLAAWEAFWDRPTMKAWWYLEAAAIRCGMAPRQHLIPWVKRRLAHFTAMLADTTPARFAAVEPVAARIDRMGGLPPLDDRYLCTATNAVGERVAAGLRANIEQEGW